MMNTQTNNEVIGQLQSAVQGLLNKNSRLTINGLSKNCTISEPTLRRIMNGSVKTTPSASTILGVLQAVEKTNDIKTIVDKYPGPIAEKLKYFYGSLIESQSDCTPVPELDEFLYDEASYLIYKLASNETGVAEETIRIN